MTVLTWRDVASPNFSGVQEGFRNFSSLLGNAFDAASKGLEKFDNSRNEAASNAFLADVAAARDVGAAEALLSSIGSRPDLKRLSGDAIKFAMGQPEQLSDFRFTEHNRGKVYDRDAALKTADPARRQAALLAGAGNIGDAVKVYSENPDAAGLSADQIFDDFRTLQSTVQGDTGTRSGRFNFDTTVRDDQEGRQATALQGIIRRNGVEPADFDAYVTTNYDELVAQGISPVVIERARHAVLNDPTAAASFYENGTLGGGGGAGSVASGSGSDYDSFRIALESGGDANAANPNSSAVGQDQFTSKTWLNIVNQAKPAWAQGLSQDQILAQRTNPQRSAEMELVLRQNNAQQLQAAGIPVNNVSLYAMHHFDPNTAKKFLTSAGNTRAEAIFSKAVLDANPYLKGLTRDGVIQNWDKRTNGGALGGGNQVQALLARQAQDVAGITGPQHNRSQDPMQVFAEQAVSLFNDGSSAREVAARLAGDGGVFMGEDVGDVAAKISQVAKEHGISPALAGLVVTKAIDGNKGFFGRLGKETFWGDGLNSSVNNDAIKQYAKLAKDRDGLVRQVQAATTNNAVSQLAASASAAATRAQQQAAARAQAATRLGRNINSGPDLAAAALAEAARGETLGVSQEVTSAGGRQPAQPPRIDQRNVPEQPRSQGATRTPAPTASASSQAKNAQAFLLRKFQEMVPDKAGQLQQAGIARAFQQRYGISIDQVRRDPAAAWEAAKRLDNNAAQLLASRAANSAAYFRR